MANRIWPPSPWANYKLFHRCLVLSRVVSPCFSLSLVGRSFLSVHFNYLRWSSVLLPSSSDDRSTASSNQKQTGTEIAMT